VKAIKYKMGQFIEIDHPFEDELYKKMDFEKMLSTIGYHRYPAIRLPNFDFPNIEIWERDPFDSKDKELMYPFYGIISFGDIGNDIFFEDWTNLLHFLQNYTSWVYYLHKSNEIYKDCFSKE